MDREIILSSYSVKEIPLTKLKNFITKFTRAIILPSNNEYQLDLNRITNMSFIWFNVNPSYKNQTIAYSVDNIANFQDRVFCTYQKLIEKQEAKIANKYWRILDMEYQDFLEN